MYALKTSYFDYEYTYSYVHISFVESKEGCGLATMDRCYDATAVEGSVQTDLYEVIISIVLKLSILGIVKYRKSYFFCRNNMTFNNF